MLTRIRHLRRDERGMSFVYVGMGFMAFLAATTLAIGQILSELAGGIHAIVKATTTGGPISRAPSRR